MTLHGFYSNYDEFLSQSKLDNFILVATLKLDDLFEQCLKVFKKTVWNIVFAYMYLSRQAQLNDFLSSNSQNQNFQVGILFYGFIFNVKLPCIFCFNGDKYFIQMFTQKII